MGRLSFSRILYSRFVFLSWFGNPTDLFTPPLFPPKGKALGSGVFLTQISTPPHFFYVMIFFFFFSVFSVCPVGKLPRVLINIDVSSPPTFVLPFPPHSLFPTLSFGYPSSIVLAVGTSLDILLEKLKPTPFSRFRSR